MGGSFHRNHHTMDRLATHAHSTQHCCRRHQSKRVVPIQTRWCVFDWFSPARRQRNVTKHSQPRCKNICITHVIACYSRSGPCALASSVIAHPEMEAPHTHGAPQQLSDVISLDSPIHLRVCFSSLSQGSLRPHT